MIYSIPNFDYIQYNRSNILSIDFLQDVLQKKQKLKNIFININLFIICF